MEKTKSKTPISNLPIQTFTKVKKKISIKKPLKVSNFIDGNLDKNFLKFYFQESKK